MKSTPKSCSCRQCRAQRSRNGAGELMKLEERAFRHGQKQALKQGREVELMPAGIRQYAA